MTRTLKPTGQFKKDLKRELKQGHKNFPQILTDVIDLLKEDAALPQSYKDHPLSGSWDDHRDLHVKPDLVLIYRKEDEPDPSLILVRLGSHSELFKK